MRKYRRDLERAYQAETRHIGRRQCGNVLAIVQDLTRRRLQELGQEVEASRLAGAVRADQRMDAATADPKANVANGKETREFLGQSVGFENELISQSNFPHQPSPRRPIVAGQSFLTGRFSRASWNSPRTGRLRAGICRQRPSLRKAERLAYL